MIFSIEPKRGLFLGLSQQGFDVFGYLARFGDGGIATNHGAIARDEEFGEIPFDSVGEEATCLRFKILENGICFTAVHLNLVHDGEGDTIVELAGGFGITARARFLTSKLIAREAENHQPLVFVLLVELFEFGKLGGESTFASRVDDEQHLAFVLRERVGRTFAGDGGEIMNHVRHNVGVVVLVFLLLRVGCKGRKKILCEKR